MRLTHSLLAGVTTLVLQTTSARPFTTAIPAACKFPDLGDQNAYNVIDLLVAQSDHFKALSEVIVQEEFGRINSTQAAATIYADMNLCMQLGFYEAGKLLDQSFAGEESAPITASFKEYELSLFRFVTTLAYAGGDSIITAENAGKFKGRVGALRGNAAKYFGKLKGAVDSVYSGAVGITIAAVEMDFDGLEEFIEKSTSELMFIDELR